MKKIIIIISVIILGGCCSENTTNKIYSGHRWDIVQMNDSIYMAVPGLNGDKKALPLMFNINNGKTLQQITQ